MAGQENIPPRLTRAAAAAVKRSSVMEELSVLQPQVKKKRVALSDVHNLPNAVQARSGAVRAKIRTKTRAAKKKVQEPKAKSDECASMEMEIDVSNASISAADNAGCEVKEVEDPQMVAPYASEIYQYLRSMEADPKKRPLPNYMEATQSDITADMRGVLIDWLVDVAEEYKLLPETLYLTASYIDRFLSHNSINRKRLQLLGVSSMLVASKYEEIYPPKVEDFCSITANTYNQQEVVQMERDLLRFLKYEVGTPTINIFLRKFLKDELDDNQNSNSEPEFLAYYLAELSLLDYGCIKFLPSVVAASAVFLARCTIDPTNHPWSKTLERSTGYKASELKECVYALHELQLNNRCSSLMAIKEKYKQHMFQSATTLLPQKEMLHIFFDKLEEESGETKGCINGDADR